MNAETALDHITDHIAWMRDVTVGPAAAVGRLSGDGLGIPPTGVLDR